jgi:hypothetical protein
VLYIYGRNADGSVDEIPYCKIGLENVFITFGTTEPGTYHNRLTFYLPGGSPVALQFPSWG